MPGVYSESGEEGHHLLVLWFTVNTLILCRYYMVNVVDSNTADLYLNQVCINTSTISNAPFTLGPRRMCGMYEHSVNWLTGIYYLKVIIL